MQLVDAYQETTELSIDCISSLAKMLFSVLSFPNVKILPIDGGCGSLPYH